MGLFDFFKKKNGLESIPRVKSKSVSKSFQIDFVNHLGTRLGSSRVVFGENGPGNFSVNGQVYSLQNEYVDDIGYSSDYKYKRVATHAHWFWVNPSDFNSFFPV